MRCCIIFIFSVFSNNIYAQISIEDSLSNEIDTVFFLTDENKIFADSSEISQDTAKITNKISPNAIKSVVTYQCADSICFNLEVKKAFLFKDGKTNYEDMELQADYIEIDFQLNELYASGIAIETGEIEGSPVFNQEGNLYRAQEMKYNFSTKKVIISQVITTEGEGFIHGKYVKKVNDTTLYIAYGQYTTCDLDHPHFQIKYNKGKVVQGSKSKIVTGPAYLSFGDVPSPLAIPFSFFPLEKGRSSGFIMPTFGESATRGFYFEKGGYYFGISDNLDLSLIGDITTRGNWAAEINSNYVFRYKCSGLAKIRFEQGFTGIRFTPSYSRRNDFKIYWNHKQDPKFHPVHSFRAQIDIVSQTYTQNSLTSITDYLSNTYLSNVSFSTNAKGFFFFDATLSYSQNTRTAAVSLSLPEMNLSVSQFYPFRKKNKAGTLKWYDQISIRWSSNIINRVDGYDSTFFTSKTWKELQSGMRHSIPVNIPVKIGKYFNWNTGINLNEKWYLQANEKEFDVYLDTVDQTLKGIVNNKFKRNFYALHDLSASTALKTKIYFMYAFKKGKLVAIRHVMDPELSFTYRPNLSKNTYGTYFNTIRDEEVAYSYFENSIYGGLSNYTEAMARFTLSNNVEIKVRSKKDTITGTRKIAIFDNLTLSTGYNFAADSMNWQNMTMYGRTNLMRFLDVTFSLNFDPYVLAGNRRIKLSEWRVNKRFWRFTGHNLTLGLNWRLNNDFFKGKEQPPVTEPETEISELNTSQSRLGIPTRKPDFSNPWNIVINYSFIYGTNDNMFYYLGLDKNKYTSDIKQTIGLSGDVNITKKWKIGFSTNYDFMNKKFALTTIDIYRDLHCWEMRFNWIPFGDRKGWSFTINVKASVLQDLKYNMKRDFRDMQDIY